MELSKSCLGHMGLRNRVVSQSYLPVFPGTRCRLWGGMDVRVLMGSVLVLRGDVQPCLVVWLCRGASLLQDGLTAWAVF